MAQQFAENGSGKPKNITYAIQGQYIKDLSFENPRPLKTFSNGSQTQPSINVDIQARGKNVGGANFEVTLTIKAQAQRDNEDIFVVDLSYAAIVTLDEAADQDRMGEYLMVDVPHMIFPAARNIVADVTRDGGFPPLMLNPVDFSALYKQQVENK